MGRPDKFTVPKDGETYIRRILDRCESLIDTGVWQGLDKSRLEAWMNNFSIPEERYFASCVLDALIYRSSGQTGALMLQLFQRRLPDLTRQDPPQCGPIENWIELLGNWRKDPYIRIVPVIRDDDPPTKSGPLIARLFKRHLRLCDKYVIWHWQIEEMLNSGVKLFLFVDDFLGTGSQFRRFAERIDFLRLSTKAYFIYAPLVGHTRGIERLNRKLPSLRLTCVEQLRSQHSLFSSYSNFFKDGVNSPRVAKVFYQNLIKKKNLLSLGKQVLGYGRLGIAYVFEHATPNASLPILWTQKENWNPLFDR